MAGRSQRHMRQIQGRDSRGWTGPFDATGRRAPGVTTRPSIAGTAAVGQTLTGTNAVFTTTAAGGSNAAITRQWRQGTRQLGTGATYVVTASESGKGPIVFRNYTSNKYGKRWSDSLATASIP